MTSPFALLLIASLTLPTALPHQKDKPSPHAVAEASASPTNDDPVTSLAKTIFAGMQQGQADTTLFTPGESATLTPEVLARNRAAFMKLGAMTNIEVERREQSQFATKYTLLATFADTQIHLHLIVDKAGKVADFFITK